RRVSRLILTRPAVEAGERLGFLPGDITEKIDPYLRPLYDALYELMPPERFARAQERGEIEVAPLAFMRGRTLNEAFIILDEAQNTTPQQMKMFLTRLGFGSQAVVTGDVTQIDLAGDRSGLVVAREILRDVQGIGFVAFDVGAVADRAIRAPRSVSFVSESLTEAERDKAAAAVPKQYATNPAVVATASSRIAAAITAIGRIRNDAAQNRDQKLGSLQKLNDVSITPAIAADIVDMTQPEWDQVAAGLDSPLRTLYA